MDILAKLKAGRTTIKTFKLGDITLGLRILTERDHQEAGWAANKLLDEYKTELKVSNADLFESEKATQLIQRFLVDPVTRAPIFAAAEDVLDTLSRDERNAVGSAYYDFERSTRLPSGRCPTRTLRPCWKTLKKARHAVFERFKWRFAEKAHHFFGCPADQLTDGQWLYVLAIAGAEAQGDEPDLKRVATRRLADPVPGIAATPKRNLHTAPPRKKVRQ
ncbi:hypothetical protein BA896_021815 [Janthinobacterium lividum]|uniref:Uncharacterized protein n=1 Tax=Janthinobacterium lividum TaxID=29581 RepID=A0A1E8PJK9_9BURK|nr:hypothetical protein BA896_021815 [Janthinobacterium lividum]